MPEFKSFFLLFSRFSSLPAETMPKPTHSTHIQNQNLRDRPTRAFKSHGQT